MKKHKKDPLYKSFGYAFQGIYTCISKERNMKIHCGFSVLVVIAGIILKLSVTEWCICLTLFGLVMAGTCEYIHRSGGRSGDRRTKAFGKDCKGYGCRCGFDRSNYGSDHWLYYFCT